MLVAKVFLATQLKVFSVSNSNNSGVIFTNNYCTVVTVGLGASVVVNFLSFSFLNSETRRTIFGTKRHARVVVALSMIAMVRELVRKTARNSAVTKYVGINANQTMHRV